MQDAARKAINLALLDLAKSPQNYVRLQPLTDGVIQRIRLLAKIPDGKTEGIFGCNINDQQWNVTVRLSESAVDLTGEKSVT